ncbi:MAG: 2-aminoethylphosphonate--pyruvate transaminase [Rhodospirillales bacterium]|nr:2-aminoethylphosphonate--pyruvate transaminase [Rhodospirillales bacterium]
MTANQQDPWLLTPGPLTTTMRTKQAMLHDWGSRDANFIETNRRVRSQLLAIAEAQDSHVCVPLQGSGTFVVEATIATLLPRDGKALILINGAYGQRMAKMLGYLGRAFAVLETPEDTQPSLPDLEQTLQADPAITHVLAVHCETTSGIINPIEEISKIVANQGRRLIIDAMSAFGAVPLSAKSVPFDALMASSNKCLEGVPGMGFALIRKSALEICQGNAHSLSLDMYDQWVNMEKTDQWRFTPPTHVIVAFDAAISQFNEEGNVAGRNKRYANNCRVLVAGMRAMGFETLLADHLQAPIIVTFKMPADPAFDFQIFYDHLKDRGFIIYPGKLTVAPSFRIGCIGALGEDEINAALAAVRATIAHMGVATGAAEAA